MVNLDAKITSNQRCSFTFDRNERSSSLLARAPSTFGLMCNLDDKCRTNIERCPGEDSRATRALGNIIEKPKTSLEIVNKAKTIGNAHGTAVVDSDRGCERVSEEYIKQPGQNPGARLISTTAAPNAICDRIKWFDIRSESHLIFSYRCQERLRRSEPRSSLSIPWKPRLLPSKWLLKSRRESH